MVAEAVLVTGYTSNELGIFAADHPGIPVICHCLRERMRRLAESGTHWFVASGQAGIELWAAQAALLLKNEEGFNLHLAILPPFLNQENRYRDWMKELYDAVLKQADFTQPITNRPYQRPIQLKQKNDFLVAETDALLVLWDEEKSGTPNYYLESAHRKAKKKNYPIWTIDRYDLENAEEELQEQSPDYWTGQ